MSFLYLKSFLRFMRAWLRGDSFWNYSLYPKYERKRQEKGVFKVKNLPTFAIVMQGPVIHDAQFTLETLMLYRHHFPDAMLILSTWTIPVTLEKKLMKLHVHVIQNTPPKKAGRTNVNRQIVSTCRGIVAAKEMKVEYVVKTRTDQRMYHPGFVTYLFNMLHVFHENAERLICCSLGTFKHRLYGVSDMFMFGHVDEMLKYWDAPLDEDISPQSIHAESYLCRAYLVNISWLVKNTLRDWFDVLSQKFMVIDQEVLQLYWHKYTLNRQRYAFGTFFDPEVTFNDWLLLKNEHVDFLDDVTWLENADVREGV